MTSLKQSLQTDLTTAIRDRDEVAAATLRMALSAVTMQEVAGKAARTLSDGEVVTVLTREAKKRRESATAFTQAGRRELAERELAELEVLGRYLPAPLSSDEVAAIVGRAVSTAAADGATGMRAMGRVMKEVTAQTAGRHDGAHVAAMVRQALS